MGREFKTDDFPEKWKILSLPSCDMNPFLDTNSVFSLGQTSLLLFGQQEGVKVKTLLSLLDLAEVWFYNIYIYG